MKVFQPFRLDTVNHCLWRGGERVELTPKAFDVLRYLVEHSDRLVSQDEILEALWPGTYVNPEVIKKYVLEIRKALGDHPQNPAFIATFPKRGYQFIAAVTDENSSSSAPRSEHYVKNLVGRGLASRQLNEFLNKVLDGQRQVVFITGEAGIGKTSLLDLFEQCAASKPRLRIARGQCVEGFGGKEAYYPVLEALGQWFRAEDAGPAVSTLAKQAPTWLIQFPSLVKDHQRSALQKEILGATRERMVREICEALESLTAQDPLVLILEDLHWVDPSTVDFISALARRRGPAKLLLVGTYRPADVIISQSPLKTLKQDLVLHGQCHEIALERLEKSDIAEYIKVKFPAAALPAGFADLIYRHSGGNPLFMATILQDMVKKGLLLQADGHWTLALPLEEIDPSVPDTLDQLIDAQFQQLSAPEQRILKSASVAGERFSVWTIATAAEVDAAVLEDTCEKLAEKLQFIRAAGIHELPNGQISTRYDFRHSLYREVLYRRLSEMSRSKLHRILGNRLEELGTSSEQELATELALHFEEGHEHHKAVRYLIVAAENAVWRFAYRDAIAILEHSLEVVRKIVVAALQVELEVRILEFIGDAHFALGALVESAEAYLAAATRAGEAGLKAAQAHALICSMYPLGFFNPDQGLAAMGQAVEMSISVGDPLELARAQMIAASSRLIFDAWRRPDAELCTSAYETFCRLNDSRIDPYQPIAYAHFLTLQGNYHRALEIFDAALSRTDRGVGLVPRFGAVSGTIVALLCLGRLGEALQITRTAMQSADENRALGFLLSFREACIRILAFDFEGAFNICEIIAQGSSSEHLGGQPESICRMAAGYLALDRGEYRTAIEQFKQVYEPEVSTKFFLHWTWRIMARLGSGNAWLLAGDTANALSAADGALKAALSTDDPQLHAMAWDLKTRVAMARNDWISAREYVVRALAIVDKFQILPASWQAYATAWQLHEHLQEPKGGSASPVRRNLHSENC
jgi:DNA-binding winged helix-turn-helix (wHTH) protein/tetratricopeptide (TPR) repeat protein